MDSFDTLLELEKQCKANARPLPLQRALGQGWQGFGFLLGGHYIVVPLAEVKEVISVPKMTGLPAAVDWFMGMANLRGKVLPVTDLEQFMLGVRQQLTPLSRIIVMDLEQSKVGFVVNQVLGVQRFPEQPKAIQREEEINESFKPYLQGWFENTKHRWMVLSLERLAEAGHFYHVIKELGAE